MLELTVRVVLSLGVVLGLFWVVARTGSKKLGGGRDRTLVRVRSRQSLSRGSSLAVVEVGSRVLVVGVSDNGVRLLTEMDPAELEPAEEPPAFVPAEYAAYEQPAWAEVAQESGLPSTELRTSDRLDHPECEPVTAPVAARRASGALAGSLLDGAVWKDAWASATGRPQRGADGDAA
jgi:flagellar protein FliO/FliZ